MQKSYALFDFDGTLRKGDSIVSLCLYAHRRKLCTTGQLIKGVAYAAGYGLHLCSAERSKAAALCWMKGRLVPEVEAFSMDFCLHVLVPQLYPEGLKALRQEQARGASVLLLTASPSFYLEPLKTMLGVEAVIGTRMNVDDRERYTGDICGDNCRGVQKPLRLAEYLAARGDRLDYDTSSAYGDSASDLNMLDLCARQVGVNPKPKLRKALEGRKNAEIVHWAPPEKE